MQETKLLILENSKIARDIFRLRLKGDLSQVEGPGTFVNLQVPGFFLRRPLSICDCEKEEGILTLIYQIAGQGTLALTHFSPGKSLLVLTGLGKGFDLSPAGENPLLIGGGVGLPPLYWLAKELLIQGSRVQVLIGAKDQSSLFYKDEFQKLGADLKIATEDGSVGTHGFVTDLMPGLGYSYLYSCGPNPMLRAVHEKALCPGQYSFSARMGCGFGVCMGCSIKTLQGPKRVCKEGPVFKGEEILWKD